MSNTETATSTARFSFTSLDICAIISSCAENGVVRFKCNDLELELGKPTSPPQPEQANSADPIARVTEIPDHSEINKSTIIDEGDALRAEQVSMALIENPALAEQLLMDGDLIDADDDSDELEPDEPIDE